MNQDDKQTWYFTFGFSHPLSNRFYVIKDATWLEARTIMIDTFSNRFAFQYDEEEWVTNGISQAKRYSLMEIK